MYVSFMVASREKREVSYLLGSTVCWPLGHNDSSPLHFPLFVSLQYSDSPRVASVLLLCSVSSFWNSLLPRSKGWRSSMDDVHVKQKVLQVVKNTVSEFLLTITCFMLSLDRVAAGGVFLSLQKKKWKTDVSFFSLFPPFLFLSGLL